MITESLQTMADVQRALRLFIVFSLIGAFLVPWAAAIIDNLRGGKR